MSEAWKTATPPEILRLACGTDVPHEVGARVFNHYDMQAGFIAELATYPQPDTSGRLPGGVAWWVDFESDSGKRTSLDGSRMCSIECAQRRGWLKP